MRHHPRLCQRCGKPKSEHTEVFAMERGRLQTAVLACGRPEFCVLELGYVETETKGDETMPKHEKECPHCGEKIVVHSHMLWVDGVLRATSYEILKPGETLDISINLDRNVADSVTDPGG